MALESHITTGDHPDDNTFRIYNTQSRDVEIFRPVEAGKVKIYVCGPTVNDVPHLGHARQQVTYDVLRKFLEFSGYEVTFVCNVTDVDDKIIQNARKSGMALNEFTERNLEAHIKDYGLLGVRKPDIQPRATEYIREMVALVKILEDKGYAYVIPGEGVYYDLSKFEGYGKLSGQRIEELRAGARIDVKDKKKNVEDFVLWKFSKPNEPEWDSPWGKGRPGWHIECSAMSESILGLPFDIHGGGQDLIFPHHEDEVAQSEAAYGKKLVNYWVHNGMVNVNNVKMSKSLGNFTTIRDLLERYPGEVIRFFVLSAHYRKPIDFSNESMNSAQTSYNRLKNILEEVGDDGSVNKDYLNKFVRAMNSNLNTPIALSTIWQLLRDTDSPGKYQTIQQIDSVLGLNLLSRQEVTIPVQIERLMQERADARANKNWNLADQKRNEMGGLGWEVEDTSVGPKAKKKNL